MRARVLTTALVALAVLAMAAQPARAATAPPGGGAHLDPEGNPTAEARDGAQQDGSSGGSPGGGQPVCWSEVIVEDDGEYPVWDADGKRLYSNTGRWLARYCEGMGQVPVDGMYLIPEGGLVDPEALALEALASVIIGDPVIRTSPEQRLVVRVPTWLWLEGAWWQAYEATATAGRVTSTVVATPVRTSWSMGDGGSRTCSGPGTPWQPGLGEASADCSYTYTSSSASRPGGTYTVSVTVTFEVTWSSNVGVGGELPSIARTSGRAVEVGEIQAIGTG